MGMAGALAWSTRPARKITRKELRGRRCALSRLPEIREMKKGLIIWKAQGRPQMLQRHGDKCHGEVGLRREGHLLKDFFLFFFWEDRRSNSGQD